MGNLDSSKSIYEYIMRLSAPKTALPDAALKEAYKQVQSAQKEQAPLIESLLKEYGNSTPITQAQQFQKLVEYYNDAYQRNAAAGAEQTRMASRKSAAGFGDSYTDAVAQNAFNESMAQRTVLLPSLLKAVQSSAADDKKARANVIEAMRAGQQLRSDALEDIFHAKLQDTQNREAAARKAYDTLRTQLAKLYSEKLSSETTSTRSTRSGSGRTRRRSSTKTGAKKAAQSTARSTANSSRTDYLALYRQTVRDYPKLVGMMTPSEYARAHDLKQYEAYIDALIEKYYA